MTTPPAESAYLGSDPAPYQGGKLLHNLILFGRVCHALGMQVTPLRMVEVCRALEHVRLAARIDFYHALRALLVGREADLAVFDEAFRLFWKAPARGWTRLDLRSLGEPPRKKRTRFLPAAEGADEGEKPARPAAEPLLLPTYSPRELLRHKDFAAMTGPELTAARELIRQMEPRLGVRRTRRLERGARGRPALHRMLRRLLASGGEPIEIPRSRPKLKRRPLVLICDVSGSMERYTRILLHFAHVLCTHLGRVETFVFSTRLTRITRSLRKRSVDEALKRVGSSVKDWSGGTLTGEALHAFNYRWGRRVLGRGAVVLLVTDAWDRGSPQELAVEMQRLRRSCHRLLWLNPLLGADSYQPLTRGARAILPCCDQHLSVRNLSSLEVLARELARIDPGGRARPLA